MGLSFNPSRVQENFSYNLESKHLTTQNVRFLKSLGFTVLVDNEHLEREKQSSFRRLDLGPRVSHSQPLRFIEIGKQ